jgi:hypothetical protein
MWYRLCVSIVCFAATLVTEDTTPAVPVSSYAPREDIDHQIEYFAKRIENDLKNKNEYDSDRQQQVEQDASTLAVLCLMLVHHDQPGKLYRDSATLLKASQHLSETAGTYDEARAAWATFRAIPNVPHDDVHVLAEPVAELSVLMKQVPIVNNALRRGVSGRRFKRSMEKNAGLATTLAALAQASARDTLYCENTEEEVLWCQMCEELRDSAAQVNAAVRALDQAAAKHAMQRIVVSCDRCHHQFRD